MIKSAETEFANTGTPGGRMAEASLHPRYWGHRPGMRIPQATAVGVTLPVRLLEGRWLVQCPTCRSAQYASKHDRRFFCGECSNADNGGMWVTVDWPDHPDIIEQILDARPPQARHWVPGETVADLIAENDEHNIPVPDDIRDRHARPPAPPVVTDGAGSAPPRVPRA